MPPCGRPRREFNISKSTVHKDVSERLKAISPQLYQQVKQVLEKNKSERHIRGGMATKSKYERLKEQGIQGAVAKTQEGGERCSPAFCTTSGYFFADSY